MFIWKRSTSIPARLRRRKPVVLNLEILESRELLDAGFAGQGAVALRTDLTRLGNDMATAPITLVNSLQPSATNTPTVASVVNQWNREANLLIHDWQAVVTDAIELADNRIVQIVDGAFGLLDSLLVKPGAGANAPTAPAASPTNPTPGGTGQTGQAPASGVTGTVKPMVGPLLHTRLPGPGGDDQGNDCNCGCSNEEGSLLQHGLFDLRSTVNINDIINRHQPIGVGPGTIILVPPTPTPPIHPFSTSNPVRYADGVVTIAETDLHSDGFGFPWGQTRS